MFFRQLVDDKLAQYAYLIGCQKTGEALIVDPERDIDRYVEVAAAEGLRIVAATETHIHADFLSGVREFAQLGARVYLSDAGPEEWRYAWPEKGEYDVVRLNDGDGFSVGNIDFTTHHTPGHTPEHLAFLVTDRGGGASEPMGMLSGDFVFVGALGRPDLLEKAASVVGAMEPAARELYASVQKFVGLPEYLQVWPCHGAGSACGKSLGAVPDTTVGYELRFSPALAAARSGVDPFVEYILEGQPEPPMYFGRMKTLNRDGPAVLGALPAPREISPDELAALSGSTDAVVIDTRPDRSAFMAAHLPGSIYAPLTKSFNTAVGSVVVDPELPITLIIDPDDLTTAVRDLVRIGLDRIVGFATHETRNACLESTTPASIREVDFAEAKTHLSQGGGTVLDVRYASEYDVGHVPGAVNASYTRLPDYEDRLVPGETYLVHCLSGARAAVAASALARDGRDVVYINDLFSAYASTSEVATADRPSEVEV